MPGFDLRIVREGDPPPWGDLADGRPYVHLPDEVRGLPCWSAAWPPAPRRLCCGWSCRTAGTVIAETSLATWIAATSGMRGAFPAAFADGPLAVPPG